MNTPPQTPPQASPQAPPQAPQSQDSIKGTMDQLAHHTFGKNPRTAGMIFVAVLVLLLIFIILFVVYLYRYRECSQNQKDNMSNYYTGGNMPLWAYGSQDAGHGGSMHRDVAADGSRAYSASHEGSHQMMLHPGVKPSPTCAVNDARLNTAFQEAGLLRDSGAYQPNRYSDPIPDLSKYANTDYSEYAETTDDWDGKYYNSDYRVYDTALDADNAAVSTPLAPRNMPDGALANIMNGN